MIKKIKKLAMILLLIVASVFSAGCGKWVDKRGFFSKEVLQDAQISDIPQLPHGQGTYQRGNSSVSLGFYTNMSYEDYIQYVEQIYAYLRGKNFSSFGYEGEELPSIMGRDCELYLDNEDTTLEQYRTTNSFDSLTTSADIQYTFVWGYKTIDRIIYTRFSLECYYEKEDISYTNFFGGETTYVYNVQVELVCGKDQLFPLRYTHMD